MSAADAGYEPYRDRDRIPNEELARRQGVRPITSADQLANDEIWESDEELDAFLTDLYQSRRTGSAW